MMAYNNQHIEDKNTSLDILMKVMKTATDDIKLLPEEESALSDAEMCQDLYLLASAERALTEENVAMPDVEEELRKIVRSSEEVSVEPSIVTSKHKAIIRYLLSAVVGAVATIVIVFGFHIIRSVQYNSNGTPITAEMKSPMMQVETAAGQTMTLNLADGTVITLNENSKLNYPRQFSGHERNVHLQGEALFKVKHDASHPFIVETASMRTRVLGTVFDVRAYKPSTTSVSLVEGSVVVSRKGGNKALRIRPGEEAVADANGSLSVQKVNTEETTAWSSGMIYYDNERLEEVMNDLGVRYHLAVVFKDAGLKDVKLNFATRRSSSIAETLDLLNSMGHFKVTLANGQLIVDLI
jgi:transmembrane sensor